MKITTLSIFAAAALALAGCAGHHKKILVFASSEIQVDNSQKAITVAEGSTHQEKELDFDGTDPVSLTVTAPSGKYTLLASEDGLYIANLKKDTVVGSFQHTGAETGASREITQAQLTGRIDSLTKLIHGENVSSANHNYFIAPHTIVKITSASAAKVFGPYTTIPSSFDAGSVPEVYKFYTNGEVKDIISKLTVMTIK